MYRRYLGDLSGKSKEKDSPKGGWEYSFGLAVLIFLSLVAAAGFIFDEKLQKSDSAPYQPPHWMIVQRLLYGAVPENSVQESATGTDWLNITTETTAPGISYTLLQSPSGMTIDGNGLIEWTPTSEQTGVHRVQFLCSPGSFSDRRGIMIRSVPNVSLVAGHRYLYQIEIQERRSGSEGSGISQSFDLRVSNTRHLFGTDKRGRDLLACLVLGARWTVLPGAIAVVIALLFGVLFGGAAGYYGGIYEALLSFVVSLFAAFPALLLLYLAGSIFQYNIYLIMMAVGFITFPRIAMAVKNKVLSLKMHQYVEAAKELGLSDRQILWGHIIFYNCRMLILGYITYVFAFSILMEVTLSYLRMGVQGTSQSWGNLIYDGLKRLPYHEYWLVVLPSAAIVISILGFYMLGDGLQRRWKTRGE